MRVQDLKLSWIAENYEYFLDWYHDSVCDLIYDVFKEIRHEYHYCEDYFELELGSIIEDNEIVGVMVSIVLADAEFDYSKVFFHYFNEYSDNGHDHVTVQDIIEYFDDSLRGFIIDNIDWDLI